MSPKSYIQWCEARTSARSAHAVDSVSLLIFFFPFFFGGCLAFGSRHDFFNVFDVFVVVVVLLLLFPFHFVI